MMMTTTTNFVVGAACFLKAMTTVQSDDLGESMWKGAPPVPSSSEVAVVQSPSSPSSGMVHRSPMVLTSRNKFVSQHDKAQHLKASKEKVVSNVTSELFN